jgi:hypothetical protein
MFDRYSKYLKRFRSEILAGKAGEIQENLNSGAMTQPDKVRAAKFALAEDEQMRREGTFIFPVPPPTGFFEGLSSIFSKIWNDPVWSTVIATAITGTVVTAYAYWDKVWATLRAIHGTMVGQ